MNGYKILFDLVKNELEKRGEYPDSCDTYLVCFSNSYDNKEWDIGHTMLMGCGSNDKFEWENDFDEGQKYYKLHYVVELNKVWYNLDLAHYKKEMKEWIY